MNEMHSTVDRLEARIDYHAARIDALYAILNTRGILPCPAVGAGRGDALFDELNELADAPLVRETRVRVSSRPHRRLRLGNATGV